MPQLVRARPAADAKSAQSLENLAWLMDRAIPIPGTNLRVGLDAILGLIPGLGDVATGTIQAGLVLFALSRYQVPKAVAARMIANVLIDVGLGSIPFVGDVFDMFFKANTRNLDLLKQAQSHQERGEPMPAKASIRYLVLLGAALGAVVILAAVGAVALIVWITKVTRQSL